MFFCPRCGKLVQEDALYCPNCGATLTQQPQPTQSPIPTYAQPRPLRGPKNEWLAVVLSFLISGLGQMYVGRIKRGLTILFRGIVISLLLPEDLPEGLILLPLIIYDMWNTYDAYSLAKKYNQERLKTESSP